MNFREVDLETPAGTLADSLAQIFIMTTNEKLRQQAYRMVDVDNNRDFALAVEERLNEYFKSKQRKLDRRSILQIRGEKDDAGVILEHFLKSAGLPPDAVQKFSSKNLSARIKMLEKNVNRKSFSKNCPVKRVFLTLKKFVHLEADSFISGDEFSSSSDEEVSDMFLSKKRKSVCGSNSFHFSDPGCVLPAEADMKSRVGKKENLKPFHDSTDFDEFSDLNDEFEKVNYSQLDTMKPNEKNQFLNRLDDEFSSSDGSEFSSIGDGDIP